MLELLTYWPAILITPRSALVGSPAFIPPPP